jgi:hypothetical protein
VQCAIKLANSPHTARRNFYPVFVRTHTGEKGSLNILACSEKRLEQKALSMPMQFIRRGAAPEFRAGRIACNLIGC